MKRLACVFCAAPFLALALIPRQSDTPPADRYFQAIRTNDLDTLRQLIKSAGTGVSDSLGNRPLMFAALDGTPESLKLLIDAGADPNQANKDGATPLMWCADDPAKVGILLQHGAKVDTLSKGKHGALEIAAGYDGSAQTVKMLLAKGANPNVEDVGGDTPLLGAAGSNSVAATKLLLDAGADINHLDKIHFSPLLAACASGGRSAELVKLLLRRGAKLNAVTADLAGGTGHHGPIRLGRYTPLHLAATTSYELSKALVDAGADVNAKDIRDANPLVFAVTCDHTDPRVVSLLVQHGADKSLATTWAKRYNNSRILAALGLNPSGPDQRARAERFTARFDDAAVRSSVSRALAACDDPAAQFEKKAGCVSCHAQIAAGVAAAAARPLGLPVNEMESKLMASSLADANSLQEDLAQLQGPGGGAHTVANLLIHLRAAGVKPNLTTDSMVHYLLSAQIRSGDFPIASLVRPPLEDGSFACTAQCVEALRLYAPPALAGQIDRCVARGVRWLQHATPQTTDDRSMQIFGVVGTGGAASPAWVRKLESLQRPDGGWGQTDGLPSDAYATGETLTALHEAGVKSADPCFAKGVAYLLRTQQPDGTWHVVTRSFTFQPYFESGFPYGPDQWISQEGTALAATALAGALQPTGSTLSRQASYFQLPNTMNGAP